MTPGKIIALVGAQRSGKTFLAKKLTEHFSANLFLEDNGDDFPEAIKEDIEKKYKITRKSFMV